MTKFEDSNWPELPSHLQLFQSDDAELEYQVAAAHALSYRIWHTELHNNRGKHISEETRRSVFELLLKRFSEEGIDTELQIDLLSTLATLRNYGLPIPRKKPFASNGEDRGNPRHKLDKDFFTLAQRRIEEEVHDNRKMHDRWFSLREKMFTHPEQYGLTVETLFSHLQLEKPTEAERQRTRLKSHLQHHSNGFHKHVTVLSRPEMLQLQQQIRQVGMKPEDIVEELLQDGDTKMVVIKPGYTNHIEPFIGEHMERFLDAGLTHVLSSNDVRGNSTEKKLFPFDQEAKFRTQFRYVGAGWNYDWGGPNALDLELHEILQIASKSNNKMIYVLDYPFYPPFWPYKEHQRYCDEYSSTKLCISIPRMAAKQLHWQEGAVKFVEVIPSMSMRYWYSDPVIEDDKQHTGEQQHDVSIHKEIAFDPSLTVLANRRHDHRFLSTFSEAVDAVYIAVRDPDETDDDPDHLFEPIGSEGKSMDSKKVEELVLA